MQVLEVRSLKKRFGRVRAVRGVSLSVGPGQVYGLLGPNGSGKTTTMACALGLLRQDEGEVRVLGVPSSRIHETRGRVAALFDESTLVRGLTVRQNLEYARRLFGHDGGRGVDEALELVGLGGLDRQRAGGLSLGQSRRLSIARVLLGAPELVVLDEPLSGLDTVGVLEVLGLFGRLSAAGITIVVSSHRMHEMERVVTHVGVILDGEVVRESSLPDLLRGDAERVRISIAPLDGALELLRGREGIGVPEVVRRDPIDGDGASPERASGEIRLEVGRDRVGDLNRMLVESGLEVSAIVPERATLYAVFESLLAAHAGLGATAATTGAPGSPGGAEA